MCVQIPVDLVKMQILTHTSKEGPENLHFYPAVSGMDPAHPWIDLSSKAYDTGSQSWLHIGIIREKK